MKLLTIFLLSFIFGGWMGVITARSNVAIECETLNRFFVREKIYSCERENRKVITINLKEKAEG